MKRTLALIILLGISVNISSRDIRARNKTLAKLVVPASYAVQGAVALYGAGAALDTASNIFSGNSVVSSMGFALMAKLMYSNVAKARHATLKKLSRKIS